MIKTALVITRHINYITILLKSTVENKKNFINIYFYFFNISGSVFPIASATFNPRGLFLKKSRMFLLTNVSHCDMIYIKQCIRRQ